MKKVRFTISDFMNEIIKSDSEYFKIFITFLIIKNFLREQI